VSTDTTTVESSELSCGVDMAITNQYLWRGISCNEGVIVQPDVWVSYGPWTVTAWSNVTLSDTHHDLKRQEIDAILSYRCEAGKFAMEPSLNYYHYLDQPDSPNTAELSCTIEYPLDPFKIVLGGFMDVMEYSGAWYIEPSVEFEKSLNEQWSVFTSCTLGAASQKFNQAYFELDKSTAGLLTLEGRLMYASLNGFSLQPFLRWNRTMHDELIPFLEKHRTNFGIYIGKEF